jgi:hypothetical protein
MPCGENMVTRNNNHSKSILTVLHHVHGQQHLKINGSYLSTGPVLMEHIDNEWKNDGTKTKKLGMLCTNSVVEEVTMSFPHLWNWILIEELKIPNDYNSQCETDQEYLDKTMPFWSLDVKERMEMSKKSKWLEQKLSVEERHKISWKHDVRSCSSIWGQGHLTSKPRKRHVKPKIAVIEK